MTKQNESRARRTALVTAAATVALWGSFGTAVHADEEPVAEPAVETGQTDDGAVVAVGAPPVPPTSVVVAVAAPPVPPTSVVVAVGAPPVPPTSVVVAVAAPPVPPAAPGAAPPADNGADTAPAAAAEVARPHGLRQAPSVNDRLTDVLADVIATIEAAMALINGRI